MDYVGVHSTQSCDTTVCCAEDERVCSSARARYALGGADVGAGVEGRLTGTGQAWMRKLLLIEILTLASAHPGLVSPPSSMRDIMLRSPCPGYLPG